MKKNLRIVSAAAAALLAVAPVAVSNVSVANAATPTGGNPAVNIQNTPFPGTGADGKLTDAEKSNVNAVIPMATTNESTPDLNTWGSSFDASKIVFTYFKNGAIATGYSGIKFASAVNVFKMPANADLSNLQAAVSGKTPIQNGEKLTAGNTYVVRLSATINTPKADTQYTVNRTPMSEKSSQSATLSNVPVYAVLNVINPNIKGTPFFANSLGQAYANGQTIPAPTTANTSTVSNIISAINSMNLKSFNSSSQASEDGENATISASDVESQLKAQKVTVESGVVSNIPNNGFTITLTRTNKKNGQKATLNIFFKGQGNFADYPLIKFGATSVKQGEKTFDQQPIATVNVGTKDWASAVLKQFSAQQSTANKSELKLTTQNLSSSDINTNNSGLYNATLSAKNSNGLTTTLNFRVAVIGSEKDAVANKTVVGSTNEVVKLVSIVDGKVSDLQGKVVNQGQSIAVYPNDTTTVDGVSYTRVYNGNVSSRENNNEWIPTKNVTEVKKTQRTVMHNAKVYNKKGEATNKPNIKTYATVTVYGDKVKLDNGKEAYKIGDDEYVVVGNIDGTKRTLKHNAYVYATSKKRANKVTLKKGETVTTYGSAVKFKNGKLYYRIEGCTASNKMYVKKANF